MQCDTLSQEMWWLDGRDVWLHSKGQKIKLHKLCVYGQK